MNVHTILNPYANRWQAKKMVPAIEQAFQAAGLRHTLSLTTQPRQATAAAHHAALNGADVIVAAGGDGTVNEVLNGLIRAAADGPTKRLAVLPAGTGNDLSDMAGIPRNVEQVAAMIAAGKTRQIDVGRIWSDEHGDHFFDNNCALAMEPLVTLENIRMKRLSGTPRYVVALIKALFRLKAWQMQISWDGGSYEGPTYLLSVCNGPRTGSTFMMSPPALLDDGLFDVVLIPEVPMTTVLRLLPRLFKGSHITQPEVTWFRSSQLTIHSEPGTPIHADGEMLAERARHVEYTLLPGKLTFATL
jgi:YegS/Rv2252/BmrU family lipid kinase